MAATVSAGLAPGKSINDGIEAMERIKTKILDDTFTTDLEGNLEILLRVVLILICIWVGFIINIFNFGRTI
jgi:flagellar biosynthesis regulator FlaF